MTISARILADSYSLRTRSRLTTFEVRYPRFMHAELMTHRMLSRNAASSRAIPMSKAIQAVIDDPAMPLVWGSNKPGMQAGAELTGDDLRLAKESWLEARDYAVAYARDLEAIGLHKQHGSRIIEPWSHITVIVSATDWANFYQLRRDVMALPEFKALADLMYSIHRKSKPTLMDGRIGIWGWHLPLVTDDERTELETIVRDAPEQCEGQPHPAIKVSIGRCARVSYLTHDGKRDYFADMELHDRLSTSGHWSPFEHAARTLEAAGVGKATESRWYSQERKSGNFTGWEQYRKTMTREHPYYEGQIFPDEEYPWLAA